MKTNDARSLSAEAQEALRLHAVQAVRDGMTHAQAAALMGVARGTVSRWMGVLKKKGQRALRARKRGRPKASGRLKGWQAGLIVRLITDHTPTN